MYKRLSRHPDFVESQNKGPHFWDECSYPAVDKCTVPPSGDPMAGPLPFGETWARAVMSQLLISVRVAVAQDAVPC